MKRQIYTNQEILNQTRQVIHCYYNRDIEALKRYLDPNFVWIGAWEYQYLVGLDKFLASIELELQYSPATLTDEEYTLLSHARNLWVVYGRYTTRITQENGQSIITKTRDTYVWKQTGDYLRLIHVHSANAQDVPLTPEAPRPPEPGEAADWYDYMRSIGATLHPPKHKPKITIHALDGSYFFLYPEEIRFIRSNKTMRYVHTEQDVIATRATLDSLEKQLPGFVRIHRSCLTDIRRIRSICRYQATLITGEELPIGKERFLPLRQQLEDLAAVSETIEDSKEFL